jgi:hypothetical protein
MQSGLHYGAVRSIYGLGAQVRGAAKPAASPVLNASALARARGREALYDSPAPSSLGSPAPASPASGAATPDEQQQQELQAAAARKRKYASLREAAAARAAAAAARASASPAGGGGDGGASPAAPAEASPGQQEQRPPRPPRPPGVPPLHLLPSGSPLARQLQQGQRPGAAAEPGAAAAAAPVRASQAAFSAENLAQIEALLARDLARRQQQPRAPRAPQPEARAPQPQAQQPGRALASAPATPRRQEIRWWGQDGNFFSEAARRRAEQARAAREGREQPRRRFSFLNLW